MQSQVSSPVEYVKVTADFQTDGVFVPRLIELKVETAQGPATRKYVIDKVLSSEYLPCEESDKLFPLLSDTIHATIYKYRIRIGGQESNLYFDRWPESGSLSLGRWFVLKKQR